jgi:hypothetical protein
MDLLYTYKQQKSLRKNTSTYKANFNLHKDEKFLIFNFVFEFEQIKTLDNKKTIYDSTININIINGDIDTIHKFNSERLTIDKSYKSYVKDKTNDFKELHGLIEDGFVDGNKTKKFWGSKYEQSKNKIIDLIKTHLICGQNNWKPNSDLYNILIDFHLYKKNIKYHDYIYNHIKEEYPKQKWLGKNDNKFLPAVLDGYGIKSSYLISELNQYDGLNISSINYLCKLFGDNYVDYFKKFNWKFFCGVKMKKKKTHMLKNEHEKKTLSTLLFDIENDDSLIEPFIHTLSNLFEVREQLEKSGYETKFKAKNKIEFDNLMELWFGKKMNHSKSQVLKYVFPISFINDIERDIILKDKIFQIKILKNEDDFRLEGYLMKNCMKKKFETGAIFIYLTMKFQNKRINLQYKRNQLIATHGKANTITPESFEEPIKVLNDRFSKYIDLEWYRENLEICHN